MVWLIGFLLPVYVNVGIIIRCCPPLLAQTCLSYKVTSLPEIRVSKAWHLLTATLGLAKFEVPRELDHQAFAHHRLATRKLGEWNLCKKWHYSVYVKMASPTPVRAKLGLWRVICPLFGAYFAYFSYFLATGMQEGLGTSAYVIVPAFVTLPKSGKDQSDHSIRYRVHSNHHKSLRTHESFESEKAKTRRLFLNA